MATSWSPASAFESSEPTRPQPMMITRIRWGRLLGCPSRYQGGHALRERSSPGPSAGSFGRRSIGGPEIVGEKSSGPRRAGPNDEDGSGGPTTGGSRRPPGLDSEDGFLWSHLRERGVREA